MEQPQSTSRVGFVVIIVAFVALAQLLYFTYSQREVTQCQADVNQTFLETLKQRAVISTAERESIEKLVEQVASATTSQEVRKAFRKFEKRKIKLIELRDSYEFPKIEGSC